MAKTKSIFYCQNCGAQSATWLGKCNNCGQWNTFVEEIIQHSPVKESAVALSGQPRLLSEISEQSLNRMDSGLGELNRVLGGGIVPGSIILLGGEPGIGKSTLMLQLALGMQNTKVLYVSGEESSTQIKMRATRLKQNNTNCYVLNETNLQR